MSYHKTSTIGGRRADGSYHNTCRAGHWRPASAIALARRMQLVRDVRMTLATADMSGKGYGSEDGRFALDIETGQAVPLSGYRDVDDAADVHEIYDGIDGR